MVDIARDPSFARRKKMRQASYAAAAVLMVVLISVALAQMKPAAPTVERATVWVDTVKRGSMVRQVRGLGTLVPEDTRWLPATTLGRVERIVLRPGAEVHAGSVILELSNPQVEQEAINARLALQAGEATVQADYTQARLQAEVNEELAKQQLISELVRKQSQVRADELKTRNEIEIKRLATARESIEARIRVQQAAVDQARAMTQLNERRLADLKVRPGFSGVLQQVPVEVGQQVAPGQNVARVADPSRLKAELRIAETQAKDIEIGQVAQIDTRNGIIPGRVIRKDPAATNGTVTVDVGLTAALPRGAVPDLSVDGTVELERLENV